MYASCMDAWLTVKKLLQMHGSTLQAVGNLIVCMEYSEVLVHRYGGIAQDRAHRIEECALSMSICEHIQVTLDITYLLIKNFML